MDGARPAPADGRNHQRAHPRLRATATRHGGPFTRADALVCGYTAREVDGLLARGAWTAVRRGVYVETDTWAATDEVGRHLLLARALAAGRADLVISHTSASLVRGWPLLGPVPRLVDVILPAGSGRARGDHRRHRSLLQPHEITVVQGMRMTTEARTELDCAAGRPFRDAVVLTDAALRARPGLAAELGEAADGWPARGRARVRRVLAFADGAAESPGESLSRIRIAEAGLPMPRLQARIVHRGGVVARVDFLWERERVVGEFDGRIKYEDGGAFFDEKRRENVLRGLGSDVVRWGWDEAYGDFEPTAARIRRALERARAAV